MPEDKALVVLASFVDDEYDYEWQRKGSLETRSFALITANIALLTVSVVVASQLKLLVVLSADDRVRDLGIAALGVAALSVVAGIVAAAPLNYPEVDVAQLNEILTTVDRPLEEDESYDWNFADDIRHQLVRARLEQVKRARASNRIKAVSVRVGAFLFVLVLACLSAAYVLAVPQIVLP